MARLRAGGFVQEDRKLGATRRTTEHLSDTTAVLQRHLQDSADPSDLGRHEGGGEVTLTLSADEATALKRIVGWVAERDATLQDRAHGDAAMLIAEMLFETRGARARLFPASMFGEPAWDILLALYVTEGQPVASDLARWTNTPLATISRWIGCLEAHKLITRENSPEDGRTLSVRLTDEARSNLQTVFADAADRYAFITRG
jgi:DNA-binding MarR family transcriptional regulator